MSIVCTICQDLVTENPQALPNGQDLYIIAVQCGHLFHRYCLLEWFQKLGSVTTNGNCPCCKAIVSVSEGLRIYPSGDEDSTAITETLGKARAFSEQNAHLRAELDQINEVLEDTGCQLENERVNHEILRFEFTQKLSEMDELKRQLEEKDKLLEVSENNWKGIVEKSSSERHQLQLDIQVMEARLVENAIELNNRNSKIAELEVKPEVEQSEQSKTKLNANYGDEKACQTDGRDAALLQARLVSYKSCLLHMESEVRLLEEEYGKLEIQKQPSGLSKRNFDLAMEISNEDKIKQDLLKWDCSSESSDFISTEYVGMDDNEMLLEEDTELPESDDPQIGRKDSSMTEAISGDELGVGLTAEEFRELAVDNLKG